MPDEPDNPFAVATEVQPESFAHARSTERRRPEVSWQDGAGAHRMRLERRATIGSAPGADLVVRDPAVSRLHAELDPRDDGVWVRDLGSTNGSFVEGVLVREARVPPGGAVRVGTTQLLVGAVSTPGRVELWPADHYGPLLGVSVLMRELFARLARVAASDATVLVQGETGTGKELVARALHETSPRAGQPFVVIDCAALPETLLESELFGHARGAFTGATGARIGAVEAADGGTIFLDEIGELPLAMQPKLLRVLESRQFRRIGETAHRAVDARFVSATHRDLRALVNQGAFREDLYFRLSVVPIEVPPLRARPEDIPVLVQHLLRASGRTNAVGAGLNEPPVLRELAARPWLGNVRELRNFVERAAALGAGEALAATPRGADPGAADATRVTFPNPLLDQSYKDAREQCLDQLEREYLHRLLARHGRNVAAAAQAAGLDKSYVHKLIRRHDV